MFWSEKNILTNGGKFGWLLYSGNSNTVLKVSDKIVRQIEVFKYGNKEIFDKDVLNLFLQYGFLLRKPDKVKLDEFKLASIKERFRTSGDICITFCPANSCNFKCTYCFENEKFRYGLMTDECVSKIVDYLKKISSTSKRLLVDVYGGEPLLNIEKLLVFDQKVKNCGFLPDYGLITNGYLLTPDNISRFANLNINSIQITIDGMEDTHNSRRPHYSNKDSFSVIISNIGHLIEYCKKENQSINLSIRMNIDKKNINEYEKLYYYLFSLYGKNCTLYPAFVKDFKDLLNPQLLTLQEQSNFFIENYSKKIIPAQMYLFPQPKLAYCHAHYSQMAPIIDCFGNFHKCWQDIVDIKTSFTSLAENGFYNIENEFKFVVDFDSFDDPVCTSCEFFYICAGGCPKERESIMNINPNYRPCILQKYNTHRFLEIQYDLLLKKIQHGRNMPIC